jgi:hypothetical protein
VLIGCCVNKKLGSISPVFEVRKNWVRAGIDARTSCPAHLVLRCAAVQRWGGPEALHAAPAGSEDESTYCERGCVLPKGENKRCSSHLPAPNHPPLIFCAPRAPLLSLWESPGGQGSTFRDGGCGRGRVQSSVGQLEMRAREAAGDKVRG